MKSFRTVSFQKVVKRVGVVIDTSVSFRTVSFQKVVKHEHFKKLLVEKGEKWVEELKKKN